MKKTFQVNINGKIFHIDEDAYTLLQNYLSQLREAFPGEEGEEIVQDIECRISEHFDQRVATGASAIVLEDVNHVIGVMGRPEEITSEASYETEAEASSATEMRKAHHGDRLLRLIRPATLPPTVCLLCRVRELLRPSTRNFSGMTGTKCLAECWPGLPSIWDGTLRCCVCWWWCWRYR